MSFDQPAPDDHDTLPAHTLTCYIDGRSLLAPTTLTRICPDIFARIVWAKFGTHEHSVDIVIRNVVDLFIYGKIIFILTYRHILIQQHRPLISPLDNVWMSIIILSSTSELYTFTSTHFGHFATFLKTHTTQLICKAVDRARSSWKRIEHFVTIQEEYRYREIGKKSIETRWCK